MVTQTPLDQIADAPALFDAIEPKRAMVIMAHPDDCEFMCGGTVAVLTAGGWEVDIVVVTSGNKGTKDPAMTAQRLAGTREEEQRAAARILRAREPIFLGYHDGSVLDDDELREAVVYQMRRRRPELVITWDGFRSGFNHRDHRNVGRATYDAIYPAADDHLYHPEHKLEVSNPTVPASSSSAAPTRPTSMSTSTASSAGRRVLSSRTPPRCAVAPRPRCFASCANALAPSPLPTPSAPPSARRSARSSSRANAPSSRASAPGSAPARPARARSGTAARPPGFEVVRLRSPSRRAIAPAGCTATAARMARCGQDRPHPRVAPARESRTRCVRTARAHTR